MDRLVVGSLVLPAGSWEASPVLQGLASGAKRDQDGTLSVNPSSFSSETLRAFAGLRLADAISVIRCELPTVSIPPKAWEMEAVRSRAEISHFLGVARPKALGRSSEFYQTERQVISLLHASQRFCVERGIDVDLFDENLPEQKVMRQRSREEGNVIRPPGSAPELSDPTYFLRWSEILPLVVLTATALSRLPSDGDVARRGWHKAVWSARLALQNTRESEVSQIAAVLDAFLTIQAHPLFFRLGVSPAAPSDALRLAQALPELEQAVNGLDPVTVDWEPILPSLPGVSEASIAASLWRTEPAIIALRPRSPEPTTFAELRSRIAAARRSVIPCKGSLQGLWGNQGGGNFPAVQLVAVIEDWNQFGIVKIVDVAGFGFVSTLVLTSEGCSKILALGTLCLGGCRNTPVAPGFSPPLHGFGSVDSRFKETEAVIDRALAGGAWRITISSLNVRGGFFAEIMLLPPTNM